MTTRLVPISMLRRFISDATAGRNINATAFEIDALEGLASEHLLAPDDLADFAGGDAYRVTPSLPSRMNCSLFCAPASRAVGKASRETMQLFAASLPPDLSENRLCLAPLIKRT
jgi:hypothetical protein